jgi:hypothetical protein
MVRVIKKPVIPEETCPYIDMVIDLIDKMIWEDNGDWRDNQGILAKSLLEHIRQSNLKLRIASKHWYDKNKDK